MTVKQRRRERKLTKEIIQLSRKKADLLRELEVLKATLKAGNNELLRRKVAARRRDREAGPAPTSARSILS